MEGDISANLERFTGLAGVYDAHRPRPPAVIPDMLAQLARTRRPRLVVDLGSGTGLSTFLWADRAAAVVGVEPNADMRAVAEARKAAHANATNVRFQEGIAAQTGLPDGSADIVTCSQSLHWMEPESTLAEVARVLRSGGVLPPMTTTGCPRWTGRPRRPSSLFAREWTPWKKRASCPGNGAGRRRSICIGCGPADISAT